MPTITQNYRVGQKVENPKNPDGSYNGYVLLNPVPVQGEPGQPAPPPPVFNQINMPVSSKADMQALPDAGEDGIVQVLVTVTPIPPAPAPTPAA